MDADDVRRAWADRSGEYSPRYYAHYGPDETSERLRELVEEFAPSDATILEPGCSGGRHLAYLHDHGYEDLHGIEINAEAFDVMAGEHPDLAATGTFHHDAVESVVPGFEDGAFDVVYSVETLQHIPPDAGWLFAELARVTDALLVTVENEGDDGAGVNYVRDDIPLFYRPWGRIFGALGLEEVRTVELDRDTLRAFVPPRS